MSLKIETRFPRSVTYRLALVHAALFATISLAAFALVYATIQANLSRRLDAELHEDVHELERKMSGAPAAHRDRVFRADLDAADAGKEYRLYLTPEGRVRATSDLEAWQGGTLVPEGIGTMSPGRDELRTLAAAGTRGRARVITRRAGDGSYLVFGALLSDNDELLAVVRRVLMLAWALSVVPGFVLGWLMARRAMRGVDRVTATAIRIGSGDLSQRVPVGREGEEIENLARAFNQMLDRIHALVRELRDVSSSIAHDLKSPIARIRAMAETALSETPRDVHAESGFALIIEDCDRLVGMIDTILEIAAADSGAAALALAPVDLARVAHDAADLFQPLADMTGIQLRNDLPAEPILVPGERGRVQRVVANLLDNAIKYTPPGGTVTIGARRSDGRASLWVADSGTGIGPESLPRVFDRFYRGDVSRTTPGHGLGLSLVRAIVRAYGGDIEARSQLGHGSVFTVHLPVADASMTNLTKR